jgi:Fic family protein
MEGSTLSATETQLLLDEGLTPKGKPLLHSLMTTDHFSALQLTLEEARKNSPVTPALIQRINAIVMKNTGSLYETVFGAIHSDRGEYRKGNVRAGETYFVNYDKVPALVESLCHSITQRMAEAISTAQQLELSFDAHFDLVTIHPFYDGNGRTSRLLMNFLQARFGLPLAIVFTEDKADYFEALVHTRKQENLNIFRRFMTSQYEKLLREEIQRFEDMPKMGFKPGGGFSMVF